MTKGIYEKPVANTILNGWIYSMVENWKFPPKIKTKTKMPAFITAIQHLLEVLAKVIRQEKEAKGKLLKKK